MLITSRLHKRSIDIAPRALCISIYSGMTEKITAVSEELGVPVDVFEGGIFNDGHLFAQEVQEPYDVIISQAGTAISIQPNPRTSSFTTLFASRIIPAQVPNTGSWCMCHLLR